MKRFAILTKEFNDLSEIKKYYTGDSYQYQGNMYLVSSYEELEAKVYTSGRRAHGAMVKIKDNFENSCHMEVVEL